MSAQKELTGALGAGIAAAGAAGSIYQKMAKRPSENKNALAKRPSENRNALAKKKAQASLKDARQSKSETKQAVKTVIIKYSQKKMKRRL